MKIACLQFNPQLGKVQDNIDRADEILDNALGIEDIRGKVDILVLPELAFTGYVFDSKASIRPFLEPTTAGISTQWAQSTSRRLGCYTIVGYPELANGYTPPTRYPKTSDPFSETPIDISDEDDDKIQDYSFNACVVTSPDGEVVTNYRKTFLYVTDESWASEGSSFGKITLTFPSPSGSPKPITLALGICMDINPYRFEAPFEAYEFANHILSTGAQLAIVPMAWETKDSITDSQLEKLSKVRHNSTVNYWITRLEPLFGVQGEDEDDEGDVGLNTPAETDDEGDGEWVKLPPGKAGKAGQKEQERVIFMTCNRTGRENGTLFMGSSVALTIRKKDETRNGCLEKFESLGMGEERLMIIDVDF